MLNSQNVKIKKVIEFHYRSSERWSFTLQRAAAVQPIEMVLGAIYHKLVYDSDILPHAQKNVIKTSIPCRMGVFQGMHVSPAKQSDGKARR